MVLIAEHLCHTLLLLLFFFFTFFKYIIPKAFCKIHVSFMESLFLTINAVLQYFLLYQVHEVVTDICIVQTLFFF